MLLNLFSKPYKNLNNAMIAIFFTNQENLMFARFARFENKFLRLGILNYINTVHVMINN